MNQKNAMRVVAEARTPTVSPGGALHVRITLTREAAASGATWVDWLALQLCGFCAPPSKRRASTQRPEPPLAPLVDEAGKGSLPDSTHGLAEDVRCVLASPPTVVAAGFSLDHGRTSIAFDVRCARLDELPPRAHE